MTEEKTPFEQMKKYYEQSPLRKENEQNADIGNMPAINDSILNSAVQKSIMDTLKDIPRVSGNPEFDYNKKDDGETGRIQLSESQSDIHFFIENTYFHHAGRALEELKRTEDPDVIVPKEEHDKIVSDFITGKDQLRLIAYERLPKGMAYLLNCNELWTKPIPKPKNNVVPYGISNIPGRDEGFVMRSYNNSAMGRWLVECHLLTMARNEKVWAVRHPNKKMPENWSRLKKVRRDRELMKKKGYTFYDE